MSSASFSEEVADSSPRCQQLSRGRKEKQESVWEEGRPACPTMDLCGGFSLLFGHSSLWQILGFLQPFREQQFAMEVLVLELSASTPGWKVYFNAKQISKLRKLLLSLPSCPTLLQRTNIFPKLSLLFPFRAGDMF